MARKMTKKQVLDLFKRDVLPYIKKQYEKDGCVDRPARAEGWNNYVDALSKEGAVTRWQAENWTNPF